MALQAAYKQFLAAPSSSALATDASLHYITTTTSILGANDIIKHLGTLRGQVKKNKENVLYATEGQNAVAIEVETALEFVSSGGTYLPGLDDNFVTDRSVVLPIIHMVTFNETGKISQIRQSWDQGSLLKQLDVIGKTGRSWPIRDSKDQINLIAKCIKSGGASDAPAVADPVIRSRGNSANILRDPHASLALFAPREEVENHPPAVVSPYAGRRPRQRSFAEILGDEPVEEEVATPSKGRDDRGRSQSPSKAIAPKIGAGKNFQPIRLFENDENTPSAPDTPQKPSPDRLLRPNPKKYQHFDFADGSDPQDAPKTAGQKPKTKHDSNWSFDDFVTPQKPPATRTMHKARDVRHWGTENDVVEETPAKGLQQIKPRRDAEAHFDFIDDGGPSAEPRIIGRPRGTAHNTGLGLYENNLYNEDGSAPTPGPQALGNIANMKNRGKDFEAHFNITDDSPSNGNANGKGDVKVSDDRKKAVRMMESNWSSYDDSPASHKENNNPNAAPVTKKQGGVDERGISTAGDGMGGKKGSGRGWGIGDDSDEEQNARVPGKKQAANVKTEQFWDF
ncbi:hypothetical protein B0H66DRAFT_19654 [Apodospora peruviana]|uniref:NTF2-like protein n=1 Tax=Apodospora peruviana TaxID=516989 RepID=A0AAE0IQL7_9PEZI|nr:hypothetical protein B0H66DRAFT_19654 [Apodospora peruviana]